ncbi:hypothetical protein CC2G_009544 [Coprinopsis cinerea AmutBmut pab1-1]|nr:hypothetical protein CC2G_009544 [Coprinopsis cinerea AmutBmut pab1-1]
MTAGVWIFTALVVGIPNAVHRNEIYYGRNGFWCWIRDEYKVELVVSEYLWVWLAAFLMVVLYTLMFLVMRGFIVVERGVRWRGSNGVNVNRHHHNDEMDEEERAVRTIANLLLFYPAVYVVCVFPNSLTRWLAFSGHKPPYQATLFASSIFAFSGLFNVVLFFLTRPELVKGPSTETPPESPIVPHTKYGHLPAFRDGNDGLNRGAVNIDIEKAEENGGYGTRVLPDSHPIYQSPNPPPRSLSSSTGNHYASSKLSRPRTAETMPEEDDDEEDYGRLPDLRK